MAGPAYGTQPDHLADERLAELARSGDQAAFAAIVERYQTELLAHARRLAPDGRADDVVQQAFLNAWSALTAGSEVSHVRGWLHTIVRNAASRTQRPIEAPLPDEADGGESLEELVQRRATVRAALSELSALPTRQRDALVSTALHGVPRARVASRMGLSEGAVRQLVHRARSTLRQAVTAVLPYPLVRALGRGAPDAAGPASDAVAGVGAGSAGALIVKLGAVVAAGALAAGVSVHEVSHSPGHHHPAGQRQTSDARTSRLPAHASDHPRLLVGDRPNGPGGWSTRGTGLQAVADGDRAGGRRVGDPGERGRTGERHGDRSRSSADERGRGAGEAGAGGDLSGRGPGGGGDASDGGPGSGNDGHGSGEGDTDGSGPSGQNRGSSGAGGPQGGGGSSGESSSSGGSGPSGGGSSDGSGSQGGDSSDGSSRSGRSPGGSAPSDPEAEPVAEPKPSGRDSGPGGGSASGGGGRGSNDLAGGDVPGSDAAAGANPDASPSAGGPTPASAIPITASSGSSGSGSSAPSDPGSSGSGSSGSSAPGSSGSSGSGSSGSSGSSDSSG